MKNRNKQNKKNGKKDLLAAVLLIAGLLLFGASIVWGLGRQQPEIADNPVQGISADSSFKGYLGKGFTYAGADTDNQNGAESTEVQAQTLEEPEEPETEEEQEQEPEQQISENSDNSGQTVDNTAGEPEETSAQAEDNQETDEEEVLPNEVHYDDGNNDDGENGDETQPEQNDDRNQENTEVPSEDDDPEPAPEENKYPSVATDLENGETVNASYRTFFVQAFDYHGNVLSSSALEVYGNGEKLYSIGTDAQGIVSYRIELEDGANTVSIKVTDSEGWSTTIPEYTIYKGEDGQQEPEGTISLSIEAGTVGLGNLLGPEAVEYYQGESMASVLLRVLDENGFDWRNIGEANSGFYLRSIGRSGLTAGAAIPEELLAHLTEVNSQLTEHDNDWLGEFDFTMDSGWLYFVNGEYMNNGMSAYFPADGDVVRLRFSLYAGADVGAGQNGETWGEW